MDDYNALRRALLAKNVGKPVTFHRRDAAPTGVYGGSEGGRRGILKEIGENEVLIVETDEAEVVLDIDEYHAVEAGGAQARAFREERRWRRHFRRELHDAMLANLVLRGERLVEQLKKFDEEHGEDDDEPETMTLDPGETPDHEEPASEAAPAGRKTLN